MTSIVKYDAACRALAEARSVDEVKDVRDKSDAIRIYARQAKNKQLEIDAVEIRLRAERRLGEMLREQKETVGMATGARNLGGPGKFGPPATEGPKDDIPTLADVGIDYKLSSRSQKLAAVPSDDFENATERWREYTLATDHPVSLQAFYDLADGKDKTPHVAHNSGENEWYTPAEYIEAARAVCGDFDLDPASSDIAQQTVKAKAYFTKDDDGLTLDWYGRVWMNPPYQADLVRQFAQKLIKSLMIHDVTEAFALVNNATETSWFQALAIASDAICFPKSRIRFLDPDGNPGAPLQGQAILYFGTHANEFEERFGRFGFVLSASQR